MDVDEFLPAIRPLVEGGSVPADPCPDVLGMASTKKLRLLNLAVSCLAPAGAECYLEVGAYRGKSLIAALRGHLGTAGVACDNFSQFDDPAAPQNFAELRHNLARYGLSSQVTFFDCDFRELLAGWHERRLPPVGVYFYDGPHDEESQYLGVRLAEAVLADRAVVIVDDWRHAEDSRSFAEAGTRRAVGTSRHDWSMRHVLPARYNGDLEQWWNGVAVLEFQRRPSGAREQAKSCV